MGKGMGKKKKGKGKKSKKASKYEDLSNEPENHGNHRHPCSSWIVLAPSSGAHVL